MDESMIQSRVEAWLDALRESGYRLTPSRRSVVEVVAESHHALTPLQVLALAQAGDIEISRATIYRTLEKLVELRLVQIVHDAGDCLRYVANDADHQLLVICPQCGRSDAVQNERLMGLLNTIAADHGYRLKDRLLQIFGLCPECQ
jgi:Fe2+ or Zn2+ uptake regulation protein